MLQMLCCCSVAQSCPTLCDPMDCSTPGFPVLHCLPVCSHSCPLSLWCYSTISSSAAPNPFDFNLFQHQGLFQWVSSSHQVAKVLNFNFSIRTNEYLGLILLGSSGLISLQSKGLSRVFSSTMIQKHQVFRAQPSLWCSCHILTWLLEKP